MKLYKLVTSQGQDYIFLVQAIPEIESDNGSFYNINICYLKCYKLDRLTHRGNIGGT